jgi:hypothetical protein
MIKVQGLRVKRFRVQPSRRPKKRPVKSRERNYIFVINDEVSYERFKVQRFKVQRFSVQGFSVQIYRS